MQALLNGLAKNDAALAADYVAHQHHLSEDLTAHGLNAPTFVPSLRIANDDARLGARYVIEGSALGARLLQRQAQALGYSPTQGAAFLAYHVDRGITHWPQLMQALAQHDPASPNFQTVRGAARETFALAATCFDPMGLSAKDLDEGQHRD